METEPKPATVPRLSSIDAYRGFVMLLMLAEVLHLSKVAKALPDSSFWSFLAFHQSHVPWVGCSLHDLIQPSFSFLVGVALPFSIASRIAKGQSTGRMFLHACWRAVALVALGIFLRSLGRPQTYFTFEDTLSQIGLGYVFLFLLGLRSVKLQWTAFLLILVGYWAFFAAYPLPGTDFDWKATGIPADWEHHATGFAAHWNKGSNPAAAFDGWFLNQFPREKPWIVHTGGYVTLSFIPTLATMILGLIAGGILKGDRKPFAKIAWFTFAGLILLGIGWALDRYEICPVVKRIWTPSWVLFSGGWCFLLLAGFYLFTDAIQKTGWALPLIVIGANSIAAYTMEHLFGGLITDALKRHLGASSFQAFGKPYEPLVLGGAVLFVMWLILFWMYRKRIFIKI